MRVRHGRWCDGAGVEAHGACARAGGLDTKSVVRTEHGSERAPQQDFPLDLLQAFDGRWDLEKPCTEARGHDGRQPLLREGRSADNLTHESSKQPPDSE